MANEVTGVQNISLRLIEDKENRQRAQETMRLNHYLHAPVDERTSYEVYGASLGAYPETIIGLLMFGRPEATRCYPWYGSVEDTQRGRADVTRWQVLNLSRVWFDPIVQRGGDLYDPAFVPGFADRHGTWHSTLASTAITQAMQRVGYDYLIRRPPCFLNEPYQIDWLLSYCDTRVHKGTLYRAAGFDLFRTNKTGIQTWRKRLPALTLAQHALVCERSARDGRANSYRAKRMQLSLKM